MREFVKRQCRRRWKDDVLSKMAFVAFLVGTPALALTPQTPPDGLLEHISDIRAVLATLFAIIAFFLIYTLRKFDRNQDVLFERMRKAEDLIIQVDTRCKTRHNREEK